MSTLNLQSWLRGVIADNLTEDAEFRRFSCKDRLHHITRADIENYRDFHLQKTLQYAYEKSYFYRQQFDRKGLKPEDIRGFADLAQFPFTEPVHLSRFPYRFLCPSQADVVRPCTFVTSGTTGPRKQVFWTQWDLEKITDFMAAGIGTVAESKDTVQILLFNGRPNSQADLLCQGVRKLGANAVVPGAEPGPEEQLRILVEARSTVVFGYASQLYRISKELQTKYNLKTKGVKFLFLAGEYLPPARRQELI